MSSDSGHIIPAPPAAHLLIIPFPAIGHMFPLMKLADQLATNGLTITIMVTPKNLRHIQPLLNLHPKHSIGTLILPFPGHPEIPDGVENLQELPSLKFTPFLLQACSKLCGPIGEWIKSHPNPPVAVMSDVFFSVAVQQLAVDVGIKRIGFTPLNAYALHCCWGDGPDAENRANMESWGLVFNTFEGLDDDYIQFYKEKMSHASRVWAAGPLLAVQGNSSSTSSKNKDHPVIEWLNSSSDHDDSVVYVGFGTQINLSPNQVSAVADALESSGCRFIWVIKTKDDDDDLTTIGMPTGFKERVKQRGIVTTEWVPQKQILQHPAVGAYLTHSGWNSVMEGLIGGALLLLWPMQVDHYDHAQLLADHFGAAVRVCEGLDTVPDSAALAAVLAASTDPAEYKEIRARAVDLGRKACDAVQEDGSSSRAAVIKDLVRQVMALRNK
ncbi:unnamed protein product [Rhodiola kirilowii]